MIFYNDDLNDRQLIKMNHINNLNKKNQDFWTEK